MSQGVSGLEIHSVSPNPFNNNFEISFTGQNQEIEFELINLQGQRVFKETITSNIGNNTYRFDKGDELPSGTYIALIKSNGAMDTKKIIKK
jgi:hypothetical protein